MSISFTINGSLHNVDDARSSDTLLDFLHEDLDLTGTKLCCGIGVCRACTVSVAKDAGTTAMISCSTPLSVLNGTKIRTIEDIAEDNNLSDLQEAFLKHFSFQCGYCTPGFVMAATVLMEQIENSSIQPEQLDQAITDAIGDHICRCTGYVRYFEAVKATALALISKKGAAEK